MAALTDDEILGICVDEIENAGALEGDIARQREKALKRYLGEKLGNEQEGRSQIITREVLDTVEWMLPQLIRVFTDVDTPVSFQPMSQDDEDAAKQDTDVVHHVVWERNDGYLNTYAWFKDALLSKTGILKVWWDDSETETRAEYKGITDMQLVQLFTDRSVDREVIEYEQTEDGHHVVFKVTSPGRIAIEPCPPEEFGVNDDMRSPDVSQARFAYHRTLKTPSELMALGYSREVVESLPWSSDYGTNSIVSTARRNTTDERGLGQSHSDFSLQTLWYTECYIKLDRDGDGMAEQLKVCLASGHDSGYSGSALLDVSEFEGIPFVCITPNILTHKFYGLSAADLSTDLQEINTALVRNLLDNIYFVNNKERVYDDEHVNEDDLSTSRPGGGVRANTDHGRIPIANIFQPIVHQPLGPDPYVLLEHLSGELKSRTGVGDEVAALDPGKLANVNTGVAAIAYDAARAKIELIARNFAELGFRPLYAKVHELIRKHQDRPLTVKLRDTWVDVDPTEWRERTSMRVNVGMGQASRERRMMALESVIQKQAIAAQMGGVPSIVGPQHIYAALADYTEALGLKDASRYWQDPEKFQPPPKQPTLEEQVAQATLQVEAGKLKVQSERNQIEWMKAQGEQRIAEITAAQKAEESVVRRDVERLRAELERAKLMQQAADGQTKMQGEFREKLAEREMKRAEMLLEHQQEQHKRAMEQYKAELDASVKLTVEGMKQQSAVAQQETQTKEASLAEQVSAMLEAVMRLRDELEDDRKSRAAPVDIEYETTEDGYRIAAIGGRRVNRNQDGRPTRIG